MAQQKVVIHSDTTPLSHKNILLRGIWSGNPATVHLLGLCPLLAVTTTLQNGFVLGIASLITVTISSLSASLLRHYLTTSIRLPACIIVIATIVSSIDLLMEAYWYDIYQALGLFIPLIVTNCAIAARAEGFASQNSPVPAALDGIGCGLGIVLALSLVGIIRELVYSGSLSLISAEPLPLFVVAILPAGAFFALAGLIVIQRILTQYLSLR